MSGGRNDLEEAVSCHRSGRLDQAAVLYQSILAREPRQVDALHLLGMVRLQQGDASRAVELIGRAAALCPQAAVLQANLGQAFRALGQLDRAERCCRLAAQLQPGSADFLDQLGRVLFAQGKYESALAEFERALQVDPNRAVTHNSLGMALRQRGDGPAALEHFRRAVELDPNLAEAHSNLGYSLLLANQPEQALVHCREAARLRPNFAPAHNNLGSVFRALGLLAEAKCCYAETLRLAPNLAAACSGLGLVCEDEGNPAEAVDWHRRALELDPASPRCHVQLAGALVKREEYDQALLHYQTALGLEPRLAEAHHGLGLLHQLRGELAEALPCFQAASQCRPEWDAPHASLGSVRAQLGDFDEALASLRQALRCNPRMVVPLVQLANLLRDRLPDGEQSAIERRLAERDLNDEGRSALHFALGAVLDARGDFAEAAAHFEQANAQRRIAWQRRGQAYDPAGHAQLVDRLIQAFTPEHFPRVVGFGLRTDLPVFVVGVPRSGTTLVEQILASHSRVFGAGERGLAARSFEDLPRLLRRPEAAPADCLPAVDAPVVQEIAQRHLAQLRQWGGQAERVIDKLPDHYLYLGWIVTLFPQASIIHCRRDPRDVAISCWTANFDDVRWACDLDHIAARIAEHEWIMAHWRKVLPAPVLEVSYEELVAGLEPGARRLVEFCGLEWEPGCLDFHRTRRPVSSASLTQVRRPIYTTSIGRWRNYPSLAAALPRP